MDKYCPAFCCVHTLSSIGRDPHSMDCRLLIFGSFHPTCEVEQPLGCSEIVRVQERWAGISPSAPRMPHLPCVLWRIWLLVYVNNSSLPHNRNLPVSSSAHLTWVKWEGLDVLKNLFYRVYRKKNAIIFLNLLLLSKRLDSQIIHQLCIKSYSGGMRIFNGLFIFLLTYTVSG